MIYFAKNSGQKPGTASLEYPLFHGSLPPYGYQAVTNVDFAGLNDYFYSPTGWETFIILCYPLIINIISKVYYLYKEVYVARDGQHQADSQQYSMDGLSG